MRDAAAAQTAKSNRDLANRDLISIVALSLLGGVLLAALAPALPGDWGRAGGPLLQAAAAVGAALLLASFAAVHGKRAGRAGKRGFRAHVWLASLGAALVFAHGAANLGRPPALLLLLLAGLVALGLWSRTRGAKAMAGTFGAKRAAFFGDRLPAKARLAEIIREKQALLARIEPGAAEALFSPGMRHWRRAPLATLRYLRLAEKEIALTGARAALGPAQATWRIAHRLLAWAFVGGLFLHILIVMLFAGYAADGGRIYWLHFAGWDF